jgi:nicotinate (nicotinamide) nucleotide adenylyltransferase
MEITEKIYDLQSLNILNDCKLNIAILGGSFDPAHHGHLLISELALERLSLDYVIWLVSIQNPLKEKYKTNIFARARSALNFISNPRILVSSAEYDLKLNYTYDIMQYFVRMFNNINFTYLMGLDNVSHFETWYRYEEIPAICRIAIFNRPGFCEGFNLEQFAKKFLKSNIIYFADSNSTMSSSKIKNIGLLNDKK